MTAHALNEAAPRELALKQLVIGRTGLWFYDDKDAQFRAAVDRRMATTGMESRDDYLARVMSAAPGEDEFERLVEELTIGETHFFRHSELFDALRTTILPDLLARNAARRQLRIWSAGCANGAEPYSIAILLELHFAAQLSDWDVSIIGTDINRRYLAQAREAVFQQWTLRGVPPDVRDLCFEHVKFGFQLRPPFTHRVRFAHHNLVDDGDPAPAWRDAAIDLIVCRNVMIYFNRPTVRRLVDRFASRLAPGGWLLVGASETFVEPVDGLRPVPLTGAVVFQRAEADEARAAQVLAASPPCATSPPSASPRPVPTRPAAPAAMLEGRLARAANSRAADVADADVSAILDALDRGQLEQAESLCSDVATRCTLDPRLHLMQGLLYEQRGDLHHAEQAFRRAVYLDRHLSSAHYALGDLLERQGHLEAARRSFINGLRSLEGREPRGEVPMMRGITVETLRNLLTTRLKGVPA